jgi:hypothetical protein
VSKDASGDEIKKSYRNQSKKIPSRLNPDDKTAEENFLKPFRHMKHYQTLIRKVSMIMWSNDLCLGFVEHQNQELEWDR